MRTPRPILPCLVPVSLVVTAGPAEPQQLCAIEQITSSATGDSIAPSLDGEWIAFSSTANLTGENPEGNSEIFLVSCPCLRGDMACLRDQRFNIQVRWKCEPDLPKQRRAGVSELGTEDSAIFHFQNPDDLELLVKVLDGCSLTSHHWVFLAATTNVEGTLTVIDRKSGGSAECSSPLGPPADAITDTMALATGP